MPRFKVEILTDGKRGQDFFISAPTEEAALRKIQSELPGSHAVLKVSYVHQSHEDDCLDSWERVASPTVDILEYIARKIGSANLAYTVIGFTIFLVIIILSSK